MGAVVALADSKCCLVCGKEKYFKEYPRYKNKKGIHKLLNVCKSCRAIQKKEYNNKNIDKIRNYHKKFALQNKDIVKNRELKNKYKITLEQYNNMLIKQKGVCAICKTNLNKKALSVDHCHSTGKVRGLLCHNCNMGLGTFKDNMFILQEALNYLQINQEII